MRLVIAARKSDLARLQALQVGAALLEKNPDLKIEYHFRESLGDRDLVSPLSQMPAKGVFTEDFVQGLAAGEFDMVVHSWKDLPTENRPGSLIAATLPRADARDVLLVHQRSFAITQKPWRVLSSSPRRAYFLGQAWRDLAPKGAPDLEFQAVRGNIPTRLGKLQAGEGDALLVAKAALDRLLASTEDEFQEARDKLTAVLSECQWMVLPLGVQPPAPAQGALAIEIADHREDLKKILQTIHSADTFNDVTWEREQLSRFGGGCHLQLGALATRRQGLPLRVLRGQPPQQEPVNRLWVARKQPQAPVVTYPRVLACLRSEDLFENHKLDARVKGQAFYVAHHRAMPSAQFPNECFLWTSGLKTWKELAARGHWVHGSDESWGETRPNVDRLAGRNLQWQKLSHAQAPQSGELPLLATYELRERAVIDDSVLHALTEARFFFWRSGLLFEKACRLVPAILNAHHSCGLGHTREALERRLGPLQETQIFLDEAEWRMFYGPHDDSKFERTF